MYEYILTEEIPDAKIYFSAEKNIYVSVPAVETRMRKLKFLLCLKQKWNKLLGKSIFIPLCVWARYFYETYLLAKHNLLVTEE